MNPFCEIAVEEAVRLKEAGKVNEILAVSVGPKQCQETLRTALAMGATRALHVPSDLDTDLQLQPLAVAKILGRIAEREQPNMVLMGKQAIDDDSNQTGQLLAGFLGWSQATFASEIQFQGEGEEGGGEAFAEVQREIDGGLRTVSVRLPTVITTDLRLNEPRYATLPNIMKARKQKIESLGLEELGLTAEEIHPRLEVLKVEPPKEREPGVKVETVDELLNKLQEEGLI